jgi:crossover junction endodeoxyribonuclease RuvC
MIILGIDPGLANTGFGAIMCGPGTPSLQKCGYIKTSPKDHVSRRLFQIYNDLIQLTDTFKPDVVAVENIFSMVRYPRAGILLGGVLGVIYLAAFQKNVTVTEVTPREVKNALAAYGGATKAQVREATKKALGLDDVRSFHAADALAVALTVFYRSFRGKYDLLSGRGIKKGTLR